MASLLEIKKKIGGVQNTRKITKAMELVAASKMRQFQKRALAARDYVADITQILKNNLPEEVLSKFVEQREEGATLFVLYTSDKGLCGALNNKLINSLFRSKRWKELSKDERMLITIGKKSHNYAKNNGIEVKKHFTGIPEKLSNLDAVKIVDEIIQIWLDEEIKEIVFITPHYKNSFTFYPVMRTFLPFSVETIEENLQIGLEDEEVDVISQAESGFMYFNPAPGRVLEKLFEQTIQAMFIQSFLELKASEYSSRMMAMKNATDAADEMIGDLKRVFNKARQQAITQEIAELIGASMALAEE